MMSISELDNNKTLLLNSNNFFPTKRDNREETVLIPNLFYFANRLSAMIIHNQKIEGGFFHFDFKEGNVYKYFSYKFEKCELSIYDHQKYFGYL